jgi:endonuclease IV
MKYYGAHIGLQKTFEETIMSAVAYEMTAIQIFLSGNVGATPRNPSQQDVDRFLGIKRDKDIKVFVHMPYTINTGNLEKHDWKVTAFKKYLDLSMRMELDGIVWHPGATSNKVTIDEGREIFSSYLETFLHHIKGSKLVLAPENTATLGTQIASVVDNLIDMVNKFPQVKMTLDYAHLYASGYDLNDHALQDSLVAKIKDKLALVHLNDTPTKLGGHIDRHSSVYDPASSILPANMERIVSLLSHVPHVLERDKLNQDEFDLMKRAI